MKIEEGTTKDERYVKCKMWLPKNTKSCVDVALLWFRGRADQSTPQLTRTGYDPPLAHFSTQDLYLFSTTNSQYHDIFDRKFDFRGRIAVIHILPTFGIDWKLLLQGMFHMFSPYLLSHQSSLSCCLRVAKRDCVHAIR